MYQFICNLYNGYMRLTLPQELVLRTKVRLTL